MTKPRDPHTFEGGIDLICGALGHREVAEKLFLTPSALRKWGNDLYDTLPNIKQSLAMDEMYLEAHRQTPLIDIYLKLLGPKPAHEPGDPMERVASLFKEGGEAAVAWQAYHENPSNNCAMTLLKELSEAAEILQNMKRDVETKVYGDEIARFQPKAVGE